MGEIAVANTAALDSVCQLEKRLAAITTEQEIIEFFKNVKTLEKLLKAANMFNAKVREYATLEAKTYARIAELGLVEQIPTNNYQRQIAEWFVGLNDGEKDEVISMCESSGQTIGAIWKKNVKEPEMVERSIKYMRENGDCAVDEFKERGIVNLDEWLGRSERDKRIPADVFSGFKDQIRHQIRQSGGHSVADKQGVYVSSDYARKHFIDISTAKINSIENDFSRLLATIEEMRGDDIEYELTVETKSRNSYELTDKSVVHLAVCMLGGGTPSFETNTKRVEAAIIATLIKHLGWSVSEIVKAILIDGALHGESRPNAVQKCIDLLGFTDKESECLIQMYLSNSSDEIARRGLQYLTRGY